jgi:hypothetical protein
MGQKRWNSFRKACDGLEYNQVTNEDYLEYK